MTTRCLRVQIGFFGEAPKLERPEQGNAVVNEIMNAFDEIAFIDRLAHEVLSFLHLDLDQFSFGHHRHHDEAGFETEIDAVELLDHREGAGTFAGVGLGHLRDLMHVGTDAIVLENPLRRCRQTVALVPLIDHRQVADKDIPFVIARDIFRQIAEPCSCGTTTVLHARRQGPLRIRSRHPQSEKLTRRSTQSTLVHFQHRHA